MPAVEPLRLCPQVKLPIVLNRRRRSRPLEWLSGLSTGGKLAGGCNVGLAGGRGEGRSTAVPRARSGMGEDTVHPRGEPVRQGVAHIGMRATAATPDRAEVEDALMTPM